MDYFTLLDLPKHFDLDEEALHRAYIQKQRKHHPDRLAKASQEERAKAMQVSVEINQAYHTLKNPLFRAEYLLKLSGAEEEKPSQMLLMESMEAREALMQEDAPEALEHYVQRYLQELDKEYAEFARHYAEGRLKDASHSVMRLRYLSKLMEEIRARKKMLVAKEAKGEQ